MSETGKNHAAEAEAADVVEAERETAAQDPAGPAAPVVAAVPLAASAACASTPPARDPTAAVAESPSRKTRRAFVGAACTSLQPIVLSALMLPATAFVIRSLGPTEYGQWQTATALVAVTIFLTNLGLRSAFVRAVARDPDSAPHATAEQLGVRTTLTVLAAAVAITACLVLRYSQTVVLCTAVASLGLILTTVSTTAADVLQAMQRLPVVAAVNMAAGLLLTGASVAVAWAGGGPVGVAATYLVGPAVSTALLLWIINRGHFPVTVRFDLARSKKLLWDARHIGTQLLLDTTSQNAEPLILPRLAGATSFGFFSAGALLANRLQAIPEGLCSAAYPAIVDAYRRDGRSALRVAGKFAAVILAACVPAAVIITLLSGPIAQLLFPARGELAEQVMRITIWLLPLMGLQYVLGYTLTAFHEDAAQAKASVIAGAVNLLLTFALIWNFGVIGACWSMVLRYVVRLALLAPCAVRAFRPHLAAPRAAGGGAAAPAVGGASAS